MDGDKRMGFLFGTVGVLVAVGVFALGYAFYPRYDSAPSGAASTAVDESDSPTEAPTGAVFYYGEECPHCHDVLEYLAENDIASKVDFEEKETWHDEKNNDELLARAKVCGYAPNQIGVPFLYADGECYIGTPDVVGYFREQAGLSDPDTEETDEE